MEYDIYLTHYVFLFPRQDLGIENTTRCLKIIVYHRKSCKFLYLTS